MKYNNFLSRKMCLRFFNRLIRPCRKQNQNDNGFTIIEVLIAMVILTIGILGIAKMQITAIKGNASARELTNTVVQTTKQIEMLLLLPYDHADLVAGTHTGMTQEGDTISWEVSDDTPVNGNKTIAVTVTPSSNFSGRSFTMEQIKSEIN
ncbi:prepilin-type N-terminal cleavage/methylation domain-containing protein [Desulfobacula sp.]|uniref:type IV pilus modification PilV family protein n=1 Tax=Desulfobacula sp. TaxID=2593537 RepID=UPI00260E2CBC|nr:prepilin-type N-terminal cleavage/methylation domain-containing protein [Desulfobacula sp.]